MITGGRGWAQGTLRRVRSAGKTDELSTCVTVTVEEMELLGEEQESEEQCRAGRRDKFEKVAGWVARARKALSAGKRAQGRPILD